LAEPAVGVPAKAKAKRHLTHYDGISVDFRRDNGIMLCNEDD